MTTMFQEYISQKKYEFLLEKGGKENAFHVYSLSVPEAKKQIYYYPTRHVYNFKDAPLLRKAGREMADRTIEFVAVEGFYGALGDQTSRSKKSNFLEELISLKEEEALQFYGEMGFLAYMAAQENIEVASFEPGFQREVEYLLKAGFAFQDIFIYFALRQSSNFLYLESQAERRNIFFDDALKEKRRVLEKFLSPTFQLFQEYKQNHPTVKTEEISLENIQNSLFRLWGKRALQHGSKFYFQQFSPTRAGGKKSNVLSEIAFQHFYFRDNFIVSKAIEALTEFDRIFMAYGGFHFQMQKDALKRYSATAIKNHV